MTAPRKYPPELRERAVRLVFESNRPISHVARDLGINYESLRQWVRQAETDAGKRKEILTTAEHEELKTLRTENRELSRANEILKDAPVFFRNGDRPEAAQVSAYIESRRDRSGVEPICHTLGVSSSANYQRRSGRRSARSVEDECLLGLIEQVHAANYSAYGYRRTWKALIRAGEEVGRDRVRRLMRANGIEGAKRRGKPWRTTKPDPTAQRGPDLVSRDFTAAGPDRLWVADLTYLRSWEGLCFPAFVLDAFSRRIVGWQLTSHMRSDLVLDALRMALTWRRKGADVELVHHSDRGSQYTSIDFTQELTDHGVLASVGSVGDAYDNAMAESFVDSFKTELVKDRVWQSRSQLELAVVEWISWFNNERLHESLGDIAPASSRPFMPIACRPPPLAYGSLRRAALNPTTLNEDRLKTNQNGLPSKSGWLTGQHYTLIAQAEKGDANANPYQLVAQKMNRICGPATITPLYACTVSKGGDSQLLVGKRNGVAAQSKCRRWQKGRLSKPCDWPFDE